MKPPRLTEKQKEILGRLEPALRKVVKLGDYQGAKRITEDIQGILRPTGHETRLMQAKNWLFEAALEAGEVDIAISGFIGVRHKMSRYTRAYLEATALLAICHLRNGRHDLAQPFMAEVLQNESHIKSPRRRREFKLNVIQRFEEEAALASFRGKYKETLSAEEVQREAGILVQNATEDEIFTKVGKSSPPETKFVILRVEQFARNQLPKGDLKFLPNPEDRVKDEAVGRTVFSSIRRVLWKSLCDPESDIYKAWFHKGLGVVLNQVYIGTAVAAVLTDLGIGLKAIAIPVAALVIKFGIEVYCDRFRPTGIMIEK